MGKGEKRTAVVLAATLLISIAGVITAIHFVPYPDIIFVALPVLLVVFATIHFVSRFILSTNTTKPPTQPYRVITTLTIALYSGLLISYYKGDIIEEWEHIHTYSFLILYTILVPLATHTSWKLHSGPSENTTV